MRQRFKTTQLTTMDNRRISYSSRSPRGTFKPQGTSLFSNRQSATEYKPKRMQWDWNGLENKDNDVEKVTSSRSNSQGASGRSGNLSSSQNTSGRKRPVSAAAPALDSASKRMKTSQSSSFLKAQGRPERQRSHGSMSRSEADGAATNFSPPPQHRASIFSGIPRNTSSATSTPQPSSRPSFFSKHVKPTQKESLMGIKAHASIPARQSTGGLFMDDDSDDEDELDDNLPAPPHQDPHPKPPAHTTLSAFPKENDLGQTREAIQKESARRREENLAKRRQAPESNGLPQAEEEILRESERRRAEILAKRRGISESNAGPPSLLQAIREKAAQQQKREVSPPPLSRPSSRSSKGSSQTLSATSKQDEIIFVSSKKAFMAPRYLAGPQDQKDASVQQDNGFFGEYVSMIEDAAETPVDLDDAAQKAKLDALFIESDRAAKQAETERRCELERQDQAHLKRERQLEEERAKKTAEMKKRAEERRRKQAEVEAENSATRAREKQLQETLRRKREAEAKALAQKMAAAEKREAERLADEQKQAKEQASRPSALSEGQQRARDERIRKQQERNRKMCIHADGFEIVVEDDEPDTAQLKPKSLAQQAREAHQREAHPATRADLVDPAQLPDQSAIGPASPRHVAECKATTSLDRPMGQIPRTRPPLLSSSTENRKSLGEISFDDGKLLHWRDTEGKTFGDIAQLYQNLTGKVLDEDFLKRRISLVKKALKVANVSWNLINELANENEDAKAQINILIHGDSNVRQPEPRLTSSAPTQPIGQDTGHARSLGEILPVDAKLVEWRAAGDDWTQMVPKFENLTGKARHQDTLRKRCRQVEKAIEAAGISGKLMALLASGDKAAQTEVNSRCKEETSTESLLSSKVGSAFGWKANSSRLSSEIAPLDAQLVRWRDTGSEWSSIRESWHIATGVRPAVDTLKGRYEALKEIFQNTLIDDELLNDMVRGVPGAKEDVNGRIFKTPKPPFPRSPVRNDSAVEERPLVLATRLPRANTDVAETRPVNGAAEQTRRITNILDAYADHEEIERPTTGGKTIDASFLWYAAQNMAQGYEDACAQLDESDAESVIDPEEPQDYVYYTYVVHRQEIYNDDSDDDKGSDEEPEWEPVSRPYENLEKANKAVLANLTKIYAKRRPIADTHNLDMQTMTDENGMLSGSIVNPEVGEVNVAIKRYLHGYDANKQLPQSKAHWIPKIYFRVMERTTVTEKTTENLPAEETDDLFGETCERVKVTEKTVEVERQRPDMTTSLEQANDWAAVYFAKTIVSQKANLNETDKLRQAKREKLLGLLDENELFQGSEFDDDGNKFEVWVEKATMSGPRNI
ncbi:hypothetical protein AC579_8048 [Pseudocercospora musae]|uniref:Uncharacterized protein n=1 Tax=Pseudocercospora musae TaxID=113226 RepID=A0A139IPF4_9PEZI|nr:hypothetical protein AC579_8048 [Pseudocercospora musae]KXT16645.1 hypothetical protein AC579_8048 [Pseudocercospora musae]